MAREVDNYVKAVAVSPSDSTVLGCEGFYVGTVGNIAIIPKGQTTAVTLTAIALGVVHRIACDKIMSTNTTAGAIVALY